MKNKILIPLFTLLFASGCSLKEEIVDTLTPGNSITKQADVTAFLNGTYAELLSSDAFKANYAVFFLTDTSKEESFLALCKKEGMIGVKGYRTVGGIRVSMYNALPMSSVQAFCDLMQNFS